MSLGFEALSKTIFEIVEKVMTPTEIPDKLYFKIGEVAEIVGVKPYVLRYWETEFPEIAPSKSQSKQRLYRRKEVEMILGIRDLLYNEKYTIEGARRRLKELSRKPGAKKKEKQISLPLQKDQDFRKILLEIKNRLKDIADSLE